MENRPDSEELHKAYIIEKKSPELIGAEYGVTGRSVRNWLTDSGVKLLGPRHLLKGKPAPWASKPRSSEWRRKLGAAHIGKRPSNYGHGRVHFTCEVCGRPVFDKPYRRKRTCSKACKDALSHINRGKNHWNFKGEQSGAYQRRRNWSEYKEWRAGVLKRANYTCQKCGKMGLRMTAHHILSWAKNPRLRFELTNGACLCWSCHWGFHRKFGHKNFSPEKFVEWINSSL